MLSDSGEPRGALQTIACVNPGSCVGPSSQPDSPLNVECAQCVWSQRVERRVRTVRFVNGGLVVLVVALSWAYVLVTHKLSQQPSGRALPLTLVYVSAAQALDPSLNGR